MGKSVTNENVLTTLEIKRSVWRNLWDCRIKRRSHIIRRKYIVSIIKGNWKRTDIEEERGRNLLGKYYEVCKLKTKTKRENWRQTASSDDDHMWSPASFKIDSQRKDKSISVAENI